MYKIQPYDLSQSFKFIPAKKKYSLLFYRGNSVEFTSKRQAFDFIGKISQFFVENLAICEMVNNTIHSYSFHFRPTTPANTDLFNIYHNNYNLIVSNLQTLKFYQSDKTELQNVYRHFTHLIGLITDNCKILNKKNNNCALAYLAIMIRISDVFYNITDNAAKNYETNNLTLFNK